MLYSDFFSSAAQCMQRSVGYRPRPLQNGTYNPPIIVTTSAPWHSSAVATLVLASSSLAGLELLEVPPADLHVAALLVHTLGELLGGAGAVVAPGLAVGVRLAVGLDAVVGGLGGQGLAAAAAAEEARDGVADGGAYRDTTFVWSVSFFFALTDLIPEKMAYAAVLAMFPSIPPPMDGA